MKTKKVCARCHKAQNLKNFSRYLNKGKEYIFSYCTDCKRKAYKEWHSKNPEKRRAINDAWERKHPDLAKVHQDKAYRKRALTKKAEVILANAKARCGKEKYYLNVSFNLDQKEITKLSAKFNAIEICPSCAKPFGGNEAARRKSFDRIDTNGDYSYDNIQIICLGCNAAKSQKERVKK